MGGGRGWSGGVRRFRRGGGRGEVEEQERVRWREGRGREKMGMKMGIESWLRSPGLCLRRGGAGYLKPLP